MKRFVTHVFTTVFTTGFAILVAGGCSAKGDDPTDKVPTDSGITDLPKIWVNEVMASNATGLQDEVGAYPDWIELYNPNDEAVDIGGWWMSDDVTDPLDWLIPDGISIPANGFLVVFADSDPEEGELHATFTLAGVGGEDVALFGPNVLDNPLVDSVEDMSAAVTDVGIARNPDGGPTWEIEADPTPGASNSGS